MTVNRPERINHKAKIKVMTQPEQLYILELRNFSETGLYINSDELDIVAVGDEIEVQTLEIEDAPVLLSKVVRVEAGNGFAVTFILE